MPSSAPATTTATTTLRPVSDLTDAELLYIFGMERGAFGSATDANGPLAGCMATRPCPWLLVAYAAYRSGTASASDEALLRFAALEINARYWMQQPLPINGSTAHVDAACNGAYLAGLNYASIVYASTLHAVVASSARAHHPQLQQQAAF